MIYISLSLALILFMAVLRLGRVVERSVDVVRAARGSVGAMTSSVLSDEEKEARIRRDAIRMMGAFAGITFWSAVAVAVPLATVVLAGLAGFFDLDRAAAIAGSWWFILAATAGMTVAWWGLSR